MKKFLNALQQADRVDFDQSLELDLGGETVDKAKIRGNVRKADHEFILEFQGDALQSATCDRCLDPCQCEIHIDYCEPLDQETMEMSLAEIARQEFILQRPPQIICSDDCKGLCIQCGANLNRESCTCEEPVDPRLEKLLTLL